MDQPSKELPSATAVIASETAAAAAGAFAYSTHNCESDLNRWASQRFTDKSNQPVDDPNRYAYIE
jgi:hypothetical protein